MGTTTPTGATDPSTSPSMVDRFLAAVAAGQGIPTDLYAPDATVDATVPNWRMGAQGPEAIAELYGSWFADPGSFVELTRHAHAEGEVVTYLLSWAEGGVPHTAHHCHVLTLGADGRIVHDSVFCGGRWDASLMAEMAAASAAG